MWIIISCILHLALLLGGAFHWKNSEVVALESVNQKINMSFTGKSENSQSLVKNIEDTAKKNKNTESEKEKKKEIIKKVDRNSLENPKVKKEEVLKDKIEEKQEDKVQDERQEELLDLKSLEDNRGNTGNEESGEIKKDKLSKEGLKNVGDGVYIAENQSVEGIVYNIISEREPEYPMIARRLGYKQSVEVKVKFLVGYNGNIEKIEFENEDIGMGFRNEVEKALKKWKFSEIKFRDEKIKMYFYKSFIFNQN